MKTLAMIASMVFASQVSYASLVCEGTNGKNEKIQITITELKSEKHMPYKTAQLNAQVAGGADQVLVGCEEALLAGSQDGKLNRDYSANLYVECTADGDAGYMNLEKNQDNTYKGLFTAPNSHPQLNLQDEEELAVTCSQK